MAEAIVGGKVRDFTFLTSGFEDAGYYLLEEYGESMGLEFSNDDDLYGWIIPEDDFHKWEARAALYASLAQSDVPEDLYEIWDGRLQAFRSTGDCDEDLMRLSQALIELLVSNA